MPAGKLVLVKRAKRGNYRRRRTTRRTGRRRAFKPNYMGFVSGMPKIRKAYLRYNESLALTSTVGSLDKKQFRANGIYDPNLTGTGHQPFGYDTWATLYNHYVVVGARINFKLFTNALNAPSMMGAFLSDDTTLPYTTPDGFIEAKKGTWKTCQLRAGTMMPTAISKYSARQFYNVKDVRDNIDRLGATIGADPSEQAIFNLWFATLDGSTATCYATITIDYIVQFSEPKDLNQS